MGGAPLILQGFLQVSLGENEKRLGPVCGKRPGSGASCGDELFLLSNFTLQRLASTTGQRRKFHSSLASEPESGLELLPRVWSLRSSCVTKKAVPAQVITRESCCSIMGHAASST